MPEAHSLDGVACFTVRTTGRGLSRSVISNCNHHGPPYEKQHLTQICAGWAPGVKGHTVAESRGATQWQSQGGPAGAMPPPPPSPPSCKKKFSTLNSIQSTNLMLWAKEKLTWDLAF